MSAMHLLPEYVCQEIADKKPGLRDDLLAIPAAEAAGWVVTFRNDHWHNAARFERGDATVWGTGRDWRRAVPVDGQYGPPAVFATLAEALA